MNLRSTLGLLFTVLMKQVRGPKQFWIGEELGSGPKILIVAPGEKTMPVLGWGAVESICWDLFRGLKSQGENVALINSWNFFIWVKAFTWRPAVVVNHYDVFSRPLAILSRVFKSKLISVSHYGYASFPELWSRETRAIMAATAGSDLVICLSPQIREAWKREFPGMNSRVIPNYVDASKFLPAERTGSRFICVGKVEPRKRQVDLALLLGESVKIDFVGDVVDDRFYQLPEATKRQFLGPWDRSILQQRLSEYEYLVLPSDGEADALVLYEAQAAGLGIICTPEALGAQDSTLSWILVTNWDSLGDVLMSAPVISRTQVQEIRALALERYSPANWIELWQDSIKGLLRL